jgi:transcriptional regulator with XRE-family HTH domain
MTNLRFLLSKNIKKRRKILGISQALLAERADTSTHYIAQIEQQNRFPSSEMLERLAVALEIDSPELFSTGPFPFEAIQLEAIQQFQEGIKADVERIKTDVEKRLERLMKSRK